MSTHKTSTVYVVTNPELGWDCVLAVLTSKPTAEQRKTIEKERYVVHEVQAGTPEYFMYNFDLDEAE